LAQCYSQSYPLRDVSGNIVKPAQTPRERLSFTLVPHSTPLPTSGKIDVDNYFQDRSGLTARVKGRIFKQLTSAFWQTLNLSGPQSWAMEIAP
jgi:hypothetical protein